MRITPLIFLFAAYFTAGSSYGQVTIAAGQVRYQYLGTNSSSGLRNYRVEVDIFRSCPANSFPRININIFRKGDYSRSIYRVVDLNYSSVRQVTPGGVNTCIYNFPDICFFKATYYSMVWVADDPLGLEIFASVSSPRETGIMNLVGTPGAGFLATIPGNAVESTGDKNSSPDFMANEAIIACVNNPFTLDASAHDADGDSLAYFFCSGYTNTGPPFNVLNYERPYSGTYPMGMQFSIDGETGVLSGVAPNVGNYLVTVCVVEYRKGIPLATNRKEFLIKVKDCSITRSALPEKTMGCRDFTVDFQNGVDNPYFQSYRWDFGVNGAASDTSTLKNPRFTFPDTGIYRVRLIINEGTFCDDTAYTNVYVYPTLRPDFRYDPVCLFPNMPVRFTDVTTNTFGKLDYWRWDFGQVRDGGVPELSAEQHPSFRGYLTSDTFHVEFWVRNTMGCMDTLRRDIIVYDPKLLKVSNDTSICIGDTLQIHASGPGTVQWTPAFKISNSNTASPFVYPDITTTYFAHLNLFPGCSISKPVVVEAKRFVSVDAGPDSTICLTDTFRLGTISDALKFSWTPAAGIDNPFAKNPLVTPRGSGRYYVTASTGTCVAADSIYITTVPYPAITISADTAICYGDRIQLFANGGSSYTWSPSISLSDPRTPNPFASPRSSITYQVAVHDNKGCPKPTIGEVDITVIPPLKAFAGYDTAIIAGQPLQLQASGGHHYIWTPSTGLNTSNISNPVATIESDITYRVKASSPEGCAAFDDITVKVFRTRPDIFVPNAFTPNADGKNDRIRPTPVGIKQFDYFRVYNRWGQLLYQTAIPTVGWDGNVNGNSMAMGSYVWEARGIDYTGKVVLRTGNFVLIR